MSKKLIMLVDDNDTDNYLNKTVIERAGISNEIVIKNSGSSALEYFQKNMDNPSMVPDLLFLDINMPIVDGYGFLKEFKTYPTSIKNKCNIVVLSSSSNKNDFTRMSEDHLVENYLIKPLSREDLKNLKENVKHMPKTPGGWDI